MTRIGQLFFASVAVVGLFTASSVEGATVAPDHPQVTVLAPASDADRSRIDLNSASVKELRSLPGIGTVNARKIVAGRPYESVDDLRTRKILPKATFEKIQDRVMAQEEKGVEGAGRAVTSGIRKP